MVVVFMFYDLAVENVYLRNMDVQLVTSKSDGTRSGFTS